MYDFNMWKLDGYGWANDAGWCEISIDDELCGC